MTAYEFWLRLLMVKPRSSKALRRLMTQPELTDYQVTKLLGLAELKEEQIKAFYQVNDRELAINLNWLAQPGHHLIHYNDNDYPYLLRHIPDAPSVLFVKGDKSPLNQCAIAMIGSRNFSHYGQQWGSYFAAELAKQGLVIISGLALGIDSICQQAVVAQKRVTIAVLGSGIMKTSPKQHLALAEQIINNGGCIVSEFLPNQSAKPEYFPRRNRIISGLSLGVLVVEAALKSGSLITAKLALEQGREIFALPGPLGNIGYQGTHWLIQQGANLITTPEELLLFIANRLNWLPNIIVEYSDDRMSAIENGQEKEELNQALKILLMAISDEVTSIDIIAHRTALTIEDISLQLLELELKGYIAAIDGGYIRSHR